MREEPLTIFRAAPGRDRHITHTEGTRLLRQDLAQVDVRLPRQSKAIGNLRTNFIAVATNPDAAMHYDVRGLGKPVALEQVDGARQDAAGRAPPARMHERDRPFLGNGEIDRNAVGDRHGEEHAGIVGRVSIDAVEDDPAFG